MNFRHYLSAACVCVAMSGTALFAGSSQIIITPPTVNFGTGNMGYEATLNTQIQSQVLSIQNQLNTDYFDKLHDQNDLSRGFANANSAASVNNVPFTGFQNYDIFCVMFGTNLAVSVPSASPSGLGKDFNNIKDKGDVYLGAGTGGIAGQLGVNCSFILENLYLSAKFGFFNAGQKFGDSQVDFSQKMFGIGVNYAVLSTWDFAWGLLKWRGVSVGTGLVYNSNSASVSLPIDPVTQQNTITDGNGHNFKVDTTVSNIKAKLSIDSTSIVIPCEIMTSVQALYLLNFGFGAGVDFAIPTSTIKLGGSANVGVSGEETTTHAAVSGQNGVAKVVGSNTTSSPAFFDIVSPKVFCDIGLNISVVKIDFPLSYYPLTRAFSIGAQAGVVW